MILSDADRDYLRAAIMNSMPPVHCAGCDEYGCPDNAKSNSEKLEAYTGTVLAAVLEFLREKA